MAIEMALKNSRFPQGLQTILKLTIKIRYVDIFRKLAIDTDLIHLYIPIQRYGERNERIYQSHEGIIRSQPG